MTKESSSQMQRGKSRVPSDLPKITGYLDRELYEKVLVVAEQRQLNKSELVAIALKILVSIPEEAWQICKEVGEAEFRAPQDQLRAEITKAMDALVENHDR